MSALICESCHTTADVWECAAGTFCSLHLPLNAGCLWRQVARAVTR